MGRFARSAALVAVASTFAFGIGCGSGSPSAGDSTGSVYGVVRSANGNFVLSHTQVSIQQPGGARTDDSDEQGRYRLDGVLPGERTITATHADFLAYSSPLNVAIGGTEHNIQLTPSPAAR